MYNFISQYQNAINGLIRPLIGNTYDDIGEVEREMKLVSMGICKHALQLLPTCKKHSSKTRFKDAELQRLCKESKHTWTEWVDAGRPTSGDLYERKNSQKREVRCRINVLEAIRERRRIQRIDHGFRNQHPRRFSKPKCSVPCSKLHINERTITEKPELLQAWKSHFSSRSKTKITDADLAR